MRALIGLLLLLGLCLLAGFLQDRWSESVRAERESLRSFPTDLDGREAGWGTLRIGRPSGAEPIELPSSQPAPVVEWVEEEEAASDPLQSPEDWRPPDFEYVVPEGRVLSKICEDFYDSGRQPIPQRVATYNGLDSPNSLRAGFLLRLPPWEVLFPDGEQRP